MSRKTPSSSDGNGRRLCSHETPLRRSPRFLSQKKVACIHNNKPYSTEKPKKSSPARSHFRFALISPDPEGIPSSNQTQQGRSTECQKESSRPSRTQRGPPRSTAPVNASWTPRRSLRLASNSLKEEISFPYPEEITCSKKTQEGNSTEIRKKPSRSTKTQKGLLGESQRKNLRLADAPLCRRRSLRFAFNSAEFLEKGFDLDGTMNCGKVKEMKQLAASMGIAKIPRKAEAEIILLDVERGNTKRSRTKNCSHPSSRTRNGGDNKRIKIEEIGEEKVGIVRIEKEKHGGLQGCMKDRGTSCRKKVSIRRATIEECCGLVGWTNDQELALCRAYLVARPSPRFWKKVSKMVPGKTAQECFDRVHADFATPPQPRPRSRRNKTKLSPIANFNLSANKSAPESAEPKSKRQRISKKKSLVALTTARHLLRKHCIVDQSHEADHFSILETSPNASVLDFPDSRTPATPGFISNPASFLRKCNERSSSAHKKSLLSRSRLKHVSPEVLKQIKNMALHEKYIDILHCREARRRAFVKTSSSVAVKEQMSSIGLKTGVKAARTALISEARDVISHFQHMQVNTHEEFDSDADSDADTDDDVID